MCENLPILHLKSVFYPQITMEEYNLEGDSWQEIYREWLHQPRKVFIISFPDREFGCVCNFYFLQRRQNGSFKVKIEGLYRARLMNPSFLLDEGGFPLPYGDVVPLNDEEFNHTECKTLLLNFLEKKPRVLGLSNKMIIDMIAQTRFDEVSLTLLVDRIADAVRTGSQKNYELKKKIQSSNSLKERIFLLDEFYENIVQAMTDDDITRRVKRNIDKQQHDFILREKLKVIKEELGDSHPKEAELSKLKTRLETRRYPRHVLVKALEEIKRFELCSNYSNESIAIKTYLDWLLALPWYELSKDERDLKKVSQVLNKHH